jgi:hypothetical protein
MKPMEERVGRPMMERKVETVVEVKGDNYGRKMDVNHDYCTRRGRGPWWNDRMRKERKGEDYIGRKSVAYGGK